MSKQPTSVPRQFIQASAVLHVQDVLLAARYYKDKLGFTWDFGDENYAVVWRDNAALHFTRGEKSPVGVHIFLWVRDIHGYYEELCSRSTEPETQPILQSYGIWEFRFKDLNGVLLVFGQDDELI